MMGKKLEIKKFFGDKTQDFDKVLQQGYFQATSEFQIPLGKIWFMGQVHSNKVAIVEKEIGGSAMIHKSDALICSSPERFLTVRTADCFPVFIYDDVAKVVAVAHSGREGTRLRIVEKVLDTMYEKYKCKSTNIKVEIGAGICKQHYQVSNEIVEQFRDEFHDHRIIEYLDLKQLIVETALQNGVTENNIVASTKCTYEDKKYHSFRKNKESKRQISVIGMVYG